MSTSTETARCRHCRRELRGKPYYMGGRAYHPDTGEQCPVNYYGGFVCSWECDYRASVAQESSFPGAGPARRLSADAQRKLNKNWGTA